MKHLIRLVRYARPYWSLLAISGFSLLVITGLNLLGPWLIRDLVALLTDELAQADMRRVLTISGILLATFVAKILFRFLNNYLSHKAAWNLVADMRVVVYDHLQKLSLRFYQSVKVCSTLPALVARIASEVAG